MPPFYDPRPRPQRNFLEDFSQGLGIARTLQGMRESTEELGLRKQDLEFRQQQAQEQIRQRQENAKSLQQYRDDLIDQRDMETAIRMAADNPEAASQIWNRNERLVNSRGQITFKGKQGDMPTFKLEKSDTGEFVHLGVGRDAQGNPQIINLPTGVKGAATKSASEKVPNMDAFQTFISTKGRIRPEGLPEGITVDEAKTTLTEVKRREDERIKQGATRIDLSREKQTRIPDLDRRQLSELDTTVQQLNAVEETYKQTPAFKTGKVSDILQAAIATNTKARSLDAVGLLPTGGLSEEDKAFAAEYNAMLIRLRRLSGDPRFSDQDALRTIQGIGSAALGKELPAQLQAAKRFLSRERLNLLRGLQGAGFETKEFEKSPPQIQTPVETPTESLSAPKRLRFDAQGNLIQ